MFPKKEVKRTSPLFSVSALQSLAKLIRGIKIIDNMFEILAGLKRLLENRYVYELN